MSVPGSHVRDGRPHCSSKATRTRHAEPAIFPGTQTARPPSPAALLVPLADKYTRPHLSVQPAVCGASTRLKHSDPVQTVFKRACVLRMTRIPIIVTASSFRPVASRCSPPPDRANRSSFHLPTTRDLERRLQRSRLSYARYALTLPVSVSAEKFQVPITSHIIQATPELAFAVPVLHKSMFQRYTEHSRKPGLAPACVGRFMTSSWSVGDASMNSLELRKCCKRGKKASVPPPRRSIMSWHTLRTHLI